MFQLLLLLGLVIGGGAVGGLVRSLVEDSGAGYRLRWPSSQGSDGHVWNLGWVGYSLVGALVSLVAIAFLPRDALLQLDFLISAIDTVLDGNASPLILFQSAVLIFAVSLVAGFVGIEVLNWAAAKVRKTVDAKVGLAIEQERTEREEEIKGLKADEKQMLVRTTKVLEQEVEVLRAAVALRDKEFGQALYLLDPILSDPEASKPLRARAYGIAANVHRDLNSIPNALTHVDHAIELNSEFPEAYYNRACYRWLSQEEDAVDEVLSDLGESERHEAGSVLGYIDNDSDLKTLLAHPKYIAWKNRILESRSS